jgi:hypothetical protein
LKADYAPGNSLPGLVSGLDVVNRPNRPVPPICLFPAARIPRTSWDSRTDSLSACIRRLAISSSVILTDNWAFFRIADRSRFRFYLSPIFVGAVSGKLESRNFFPKRSNDVRVALNRSTAVHFVVQPASRFAETQRAFIVTQPTVDCVMDHSTVDVDPAVQPLRCTTALVMASEPSSLDAVNLKVALDHAAVGTPVFPVTVVQGPDGRWKKRPAIKGWRDVATTDPDQIRRWWQEFPEAVPGTELGRAGLVVIDADRHDPNQDGVQAFVGLRAGRQESPHPQTLTAGGGEHHFYRQPPGCVFGNREGNLPEGINVRGQGGFVVAHGSVRPDGAIWEPAPGAPELAAGFRADAIPELPSWLAEILAPASSGQDSPPIAPTDSAPLGREQAYALAALDSCVGELEQTPPGKRNNCLNAIAYRLGRMVVRGWIDQRIVVDRLIAACQGNRLAFDDGEDSVRDTIQSGLTAGASRPHGDLPAASQAKVDRPETSSPIIPVLWDGDASPNKTKWLVRDLIPFGSVGLMVGESRAGKTFLALNLAQALSKGDTFLTKRARAGGTLYVAAEAPGTIPGRLRAARLGPLECFLDETGNDKGTGQEPSPLCIATLSKVPALLTDGGQGQLIATAIDVSDEMRGRFDLPLSLIVIDTMLAAFDIRDWNDPGETRRIMSTLSLVAEKTGTVVLGVHHHGKDVSRGAAGSYALTAAADFVLSVFADVETDGVVSGRRVSLTKLRDGPTGWSCEFGLHPFKIGVDDEGVDIVSAFVDPKASTAGFIRTGLTQQKKKPASESLIAFNKALDETLQQSGADRTIPGKGTVRTVRLADVRASFARHYQPKGGSTKNADAERQAFTRALKAVLEEGTVEQESWEGRDWLWRKDE